MVARFKTADVRNVMAALQAILDDAADVAEGSYRTWTGTGWVWNQTIWRQEDPEGFRLWRNGTRALRALRALKS